ncbi:MAG: LamG domain-containing protein [Terrimicrobiaceae bacterium]|nr:LamG domain-containing protein [Terrimicrobiaceae bacterium]
MKMFHLPLVAFLVAATVLCGTTADASVVAYWRFDDQADGSRLLAQEGSTVPGTFTVTADYSGNGNDLRTFNNPPPPVQTSGLFVSSVPGSPIPQTGAPNIRSVLFEGGQDFYTVGGAPLTTFAPSGDFTIEASFTNSNPDNGFRTFLGRDRENNDAPAGRLFYQLSGVNGGLRVALDDSAGVTRVIESSFVPDLNTWYNTTVVSSGTTLSLYLQNPDQSWSVLGTSETAGGLVSTASPTTWTVGRGWFGGPADFWQGGVDEVRISDTALSTSEFLWSIPEPGTVTLLGWAAGALLCHRRSRRPCRA